MILTYYPSQPIKLQEKKLTLLQTNNRKFYCDLLLTFQDLGDQVTFSDDDFHLLDCEKSICWLGDVFINSEINKYLQVQLIKKLINQLDEEERNKLSELDRRLKAKVLDASFRFDLSLTVDNQCDFTKLIKYCGLSFVPEIKQDAYDIISTVIKSLSELNDSRMVVLKDADHYLGVSQLEELVRLVNTLGKTVLLVSFSEINCGEKIHECDYYYVDEDFEVWKQ